MKKVLMVLLFAVAVCGFWSQNLLAGVPAEIEANTPGMINYQGLLRAPGEQGGTMLYTDGLYTFDVRLYRSISGGTPVWGGTYTTYVREGYFNMMLGGETGSPLAGVTYPHNMLWKALWPDSDIPENEFNTLFLGITPHQDKYNQPISAQDRVELAPRQQLLAGPYAFRAQVAEYASRATDDFAVDGRLNTQDITVKIGNHKLIDTWQTPGGTRVVDIGSGNGVDPTRVGVSAQSLLFTAWSNVNFYGMSAPIEFRTYSSARIYMEASGKATLKGTGVDISGGSTGIKLIGTGGIRGNSDLNWQKKSNSSAYAKPFIVERHTISISSGAQTINYDTGYSTTDYSAMIVGISPSGFTSGAGEAYSRKLMVVNGSQWRISLVRDTPTSYGQTLNVDVLYINKYLITDNR